MGNITQEDIIRAEAIASVKSGGGRLILSRLDELPCDTRNQPEWRNIQALAYAYLGANESAVSLWQSLIDEGLWSEELVIEMSRALLALGQPQDSEQLIDQWQSETEEGLSAALAEELLESLLAQRDPDKSASIVGLASRHLPPNSQAQTNALVRARIAGGDWIALAEEGENLTTTIFRVAETLQKEGGLPEAKLALQHLISLESDDVEVWIRLARVLWQLGEENEAMNLLADAYEKFGESAELLEAISKTCIDDRCFELAGGWVTQLENLLGSEDQRVQSLAAEVMLGLGDLQALQDLLSASDDENSGLDSARVDFYSRINHPERAIFYQQRITERNNRSQESLLASARLASSAGQAQQAIAFAQEALDAFPKSLSASALLVAHQGKDVELKHLHRIRNALHRGRMPIKHKAWLSHCLAEYHHSIKDHEIAAELYGLSNKLNEPAEEARYEKQVHRDWIRELMEAFTDFECPESDSAAQLENMPVPVFVVGVPRSGTTLTEQILSRHPSITGMGECPYVSTSFGWLRHPQSASQTQCSIKDALSRYSQTDLENWRVRFLEYISPHAEHGEDINGRRFVDKMPDNYSLVGWIFTLFPNARVIYARRDPREIALSCWKANFGAINWAYRIEDIADRIVQHHKIMSLWQQKFRDRIFVSDYADLVTQPEAQTRKMLAYLGLEWDPVCGDHTQAESVVRTASVNQVRQPVFQSSLEAWRAYESMLDPAIEVFREHNLI